MSSVKNEDIYRVSYIDALIKTFSLVLVILRFLLFLSLCVLGVINKMVKLTIKVILKIENFLDR